MIHFALLSVALLGADDGRWKLAAEGDGVKVYFREKEAGGIREMRAQGLLDGSPQAVWRVLRDYEAYPKTMPYTAEGRVLRRSTADKEILFYTRITPPLVSERDYLIRLIDESDWRDGAGFLKVSWTTVNSEDDLVPVKPDIVRVRLNEGYWLLEPREGGKKTFATYFVYTSPGGSIPAWIANRVNNTAVPEVFAAIKKALKK